MSAYTIAMTPEAVFPNFVAGEAYNAIHLTPPAGENKTYFSRLGAAVRFPMDKATTLHSTDPAFLKVALFTKFTKKSKARVMNAISLAPETQAVVDQVISAMTEAEKAELPDEVEEESDDEIPGILRHILISQHLDHLLSHLKRRESEGKEGSEEKKGKDADKKMDTDEDDKAGTTCAADDILGRGIKKAVRSKTVSKKDSDKDAEMKDDE